MSKIYPHIDICDTRQERRKQGKERKKGFETVQYNTYEAFVRDGVKKMIAEVQK